MQIEGPTVVIMVWFITRSPSAVAVIASLICFMVTGIIEGSALGASGRWSMVFPELGCLGVDPSIFLGKLGWLGLSPRSRRYYLKGTVS